MLEATVSKLYLGPDRETSLPQTSLTLELDGIIGDKHRGFIKTSDVRDKPIPKGLQVRNWRQWSAVSEEELAEIARKLGVPEIDGSLLRANITFKGIENLTRLGPGTDLCFPGGTILRVEDDNVPCIWPGGWVEEVYPQVKPADFVKAAMGLRGLVGVVHRPGIINVDDKVEVKQYKSKTF